MAATELIVFTGLQAAGKSTYYHKHFAATHVHVSKDLMKNAANREATQLLMIEKALAERKSVVVDNTNPTPDVRAPLIALAHRHGARAVACFFECNVRDAIARNETRRGTARVPKVAIFTTAKKIVPPSLEEGFDEIRVIASWS